jgi:hypothetical protein
MTSNRLYTPSIGRCEPRNDSTWTLFVFRLRAWLKVIRIEAETEVVTGKMFYFRNAVHIW